MSSQKQVKTENDDNGDDKKCPPGMVWSTEHSKCVPSGGNGNGGDKKKEDQAGDAAGKGADVGEQPPTSDTNPSQTHECPPGTSWNQGANGGLGGCEPSGDPAGTPGGGGTGAPDTPGKEYLKEFYKMIEALQVGHTNYNQMLLEKLTARLGMPAKMKPEAASFGTKGSSKVNDEAFKSVYESTVARPAAWFENVKTGKLSGLESNMAWNINIEGYLNTLTKHYMSWGHGAVRSRSEMDTMKGEAVTITAGDMPQTFAKQVYVIPGGRMRVPIRQFLDTQVITDADRHNWYKIDSFDLDDTTAEGTEPTNEAQTVTKVQAIPALRRAVQTINFSDIENAPFDLIEAFNKAAALGSISEEAKEVLDTTYNADLSNTNWVRGDTGADISGAPGDDDLVGLGTFAQEGIYAALDFIERQGGDTSPGNVAVFMHPKQVRELILDTAADFFTGQNPLNHRSLGVLENRLGVDIVPTNKVFTTSGATNTDAHRAVVTVKGSIGLVSAADLQIEAQRRPDLSAVKVGARHRIKGAVIDETMTCRISSAI